jgi:hypothetical protein
VLYAALVCLKISLHRSTDYWLKHRCGCVIFWLNRRLHAVDFLSFIFSKLQTSVPIYSQSWTPKVIHAPTSAPITPVTWRLNSPCLSPSLAFHENDRLWGGMTVPPLETVRTPDVPGLLLLHVLLMKCTPASYFSSYSCS